MTDTDAPNFGPPDDYEPPPATPFHLSGRQLTDDEPWQETFSILGTAPQGALSDLAAGIDIKDGNIVYSSTAIVRFLRAVIVPGDEQRFDVLLANKDRPMPVEQLGSVMLWAAGVVAGRPTGALPSSQPGLQEGGAGSEAEQPGPGGPEAG